MPERDNARSRALRQLLNRLDANKPRLAKQFLVKPEDTLEMWMKKFLPEDSYASSTSSYVTYLCDVHREVRSLTQS